MSKIEIDAEVSDTEYAANRADILRSARALTDQFEWPETPTVHDVIRIAEFLAGDGVR